MTLPRGTLAAALVWIALGAGPLVGDGPATTSLAAQARDDVEMLGRVHGTTPPAAYYALKARNPDAFRFSRAWMARNPALERTVPAVPGEPPRFRFDAARLAREGGTGVEARPGARTAAAAEGGGQAVTGTFQVPLILGTFADDPSAAYTTDEVQVEFFDGPNSRHATIEAYYDDISRGRIDLQGITHPWVQVGLTRAEVVGEDQGLGPDAQVGLFIVEVLAALDDGSVDWGRYDNDGPDGVPNSGDDDGFVDVMAVMHSTWGAECGGSGSASRIWSHKWTLSAATGNPYVTATPAAGGGGFIRVDDYAIQPVETCGGGALNEIGVLAHELGHAFGLPDLYAVGQGHQAVGEWGLMGSGSWGCEGARPERPCHMSAWSKSVLGWVDVTTLEPGTDHGVVRLPPVEETGAVVRVDAGDGSGEYFLLENRQPMGFDRYLHEPGLLVWHVDPHQVEARWPSNTVNSNAFHMGVWLRQADGRNDLARPGGGRGDGGDPFPGTGLNTDFHAGSNPASFTHGGSATGLTLMDVALDGGDVVLRLLTRFQTVAVSVEGAMGEAELLVDDVAVPTSGHTFLSAPFQEHEIVARGGQPAGEGLRVGFEWSDEPTAPRSRAWVTGLEDASLVARFGGLEARLGVVLTGGVFGVAPGVVDVNPVVPLEETGRWYPEGTQVRLEARPNTGYGFGEWGGAAAGQDNPAVVEMDGPADVQAVFELVYGVPGSQRAELVAARTGSVQLEAENGARPVTWTLDDGELPRGMELREDGLIVGAPLEDGEFVLQMRATDAQGLQAGGVVVLDVSAPVLGVADLAGPMLTRPHGLTPTELEYLDIRGNGNGTYDLGDFRAFYLAFPGLPEVATRVADPVNLTLPLVRFPTGGGP